MPSSNWPIAKLLFRSLVDYPGRIVMIDKNRSITARELIETTISFTSHLKERGIDENAIIGLRTSNSYFGLLSILSISMIGCRWALLTKEAADATSFSITHTLDFHKHEGDFRKNAIFVDEDWFRPRRSSNYRDYVMSRKHDNWMIAHSSGTTGQVKFMNITNSVAADRIARAIPFGDVEQPRALILFRPLSVIWVLYTLATLMRGGTLVDLEKEKDVVFSKVNFITGSPILINDFFVSLIGPNRIKATVSLVGARFSSQLRDLLAEKFDKIVQRYGSTETGIIAHGDVSSLSPDTGRIGPILPSVEVSIKCPDTGLILGKNEWGKIRIRSPWSISNYLDPPDQPCCDDGWFEPGDIALIDSNDTLFINGRVDDLINIGGTKIDASGLDRQLENIKGISRAAIFLDDRDTARDFLSIAIIPDCGADIRTVYSIVRSHFQSLFLGSLGQINIFFVEELPKTDTGKVIRKNISAHVRQEGKPPFS